MRKLEKNSNLIRLLVMGAFLIVLDSLYILSAHSNTPTLKDNFQKELSLFHSQYNFPGATAAYVLPDGTAEIFAIGESDLENKIEMTPNSRMLAASIGKTFVGATLLAMAQDSLINLDDPVSKWLGEKTWYKYIPNHKSITIRHLLNHTSGIPNHVENEQFVKDFSKRWQETDKPFSLDELISYILNKKPLFASGTAWSYTDSGYILLGLLIENITGNSWYDEVKSRFLKPLNLALTSPSNQIQLLDLAAGYMAGDNSFGLPPKTTSSSGKMVWNPQVEQSGGGFISNSGDLAKWGKALYEGKAMKGDYLSKLLKPVRISEDNNQVSYGIATAIYSKGPFGPTYGHGGWIPGYSSSLRYYPDHGIAVAFQINTDIGIVDGSTQLVQDMEKRLIEKVISFKKSNT